jgi:ergothioneine biosynthesis protein EgtB
MTSSPGSTAAQAACLADDYRRIRQTTRILAEPLSAEDAALQSMPCASPVKWHLAHTSWFFEQHVLRPARGDAHVAFDRAFDRLFGPAWPRERRGLVSRPDLETVLDYRDWIDLRVLALFADPAEGARHADVIEFGLQHEQRHQERLLADVKHLLAFHPAAPAYYPRPDVPADLDATARAPLRTVEFEGGLHWIGAGDSGFAFEQERPRHRQWLEPFALGERLVTNGEYREFIDAGGYERVEFWSAEGWRAKVAQGWRAPLYWTLDEPAMHFTLGGLQPLDPAAPVVHVSRHEAAAYARFAGARLPSEAEWEAAARKVAPQGPFLESGTFSPATARTTPSPVLQQTYGVAWQWTGSAATPYPGARDDGAVPARALGARYDAAQAVARSGSCITPGGHVRPSLRLFLNPDARWQFTGIRLAKDRLGSP